MSLKHTDPLLAVARGLIAFVMVAFVIGLVGVAIAAGAVIVMYPTVLAKLAEHGAPAAAGSVLPFP